MEGNNELRLNQATMIQALQHWLSSKMPDKTPKVTSVEYSTNHLLDQGSFLIKISSEKNEVS